MLASDVLVDPHPLRRHVIQLVGHLVEFLLDGDDPANQALPEPLAAGAAAMALVLLRAEARGSGAPAGSPAAVAWLVALRAAPGRLQPSGLFGLPCVVWTSR